MTMPILIGDSCSDLDHKLFEERDIVRLSFSYILNEEVYADNNDEAETDQFYQRLINGERGKTSQVNYQEMVEIFTGLLPQNRPILYISFSAGLSSTYHSACTAAEDVMKANPGADITVVDSYSASLAGALILLEADNLRREGKSKDEIVAWIEANKMRCHHFFTVEDLSYLKEGGRLSAAAAFIGDILNIQPLLLIDANGKIMPYRKERGRKKVFKAILAEMEARAEDLENQVVALGHGFCEKDALAFKNILLSKHKVKDVIMGRVGPVIGIHVGPSVIAFFFWGKERREVG